MAQKGGWVLIGIFLVACAGPQPVLYPNTHLSSVGKEQADIDIEQCQQMAEEGGATSGDGKEEALAKQTVVGGAVGAASGAVGGAVVGSVGSGSMVGAAVGATMGFLRGLLSSPQPSHAYMNFVNRCLQERGYEPTGWN